jgi:hypothetical protein
MKREKSQVKQFLILLVGMAVLCSPSGHNELVSDVGNDLP